MARVLDDIKADTAAARSQEAKENGAGAAGTTGKPVPGKGEVGKSLALPKSVVEEGVRITKECLDLVVEVE
jgi:hypothetical protein